MLVEWLLFYIGIAESPFGINRQTELQNVSGIMTKGKRLGTTVTQMGTCRSMCYLRWCVMLNPRRGG